MPRLPHTLILRTSPQIAGAELCAALGISRIMLHYLRRHHGFPTPVRVGNASLTSTAAIMRWATERNIAVKWV